MISQQGRCLCQAISYEVTANPLRVIVCHCKFCQRNTGSAYLVEPIFEKSGFTVTSGQAKTYRHTSKGSGKQLDIHFCENCGTKIYLSFERFSDLVGVFGGTFDDPDWFDRNSRYTKHIFVSMAQRGTILPAGVRLFDEHVIDKDDEPIDPIVYEHHRVVD
ncbi:MAG: GFA family protein [Pseudomonadota bacterium]